MIINQIVKGSGGAAPTTRYGLNDKAWAGDLVTDSNGNVTMRTDQAVGTLTGLETATSIDLEGRFSGSTGLVGTVNLGSLESGVLTSTFRNTGITGINLRKMRVCSRCGGMCANDTALTSVDLSDTVYISGEAEIGGLSLAFLGCTSLRELRLPAVRLDSWSWAEDEDPDTGETSIYYWDGIDALLGMIRGCRNLVVHLSSSIGEDLANLEGSDEREYLFGALCGLDFETMASCSVVYDLPPNDPFNFTVGTRNYEAQRQPSSDIATALAWRYSDNEIVYTSGLSAPQVGDSVYSDSDCTVVLGTVSELLPVYEYVEPEPEEGEE